MSSAPVMGGTSIRQQAGRTRKARFFFMTNAEINLFMIVVLELVKRLTAMAWPGNTHV